MLVDKSELVGLHAKLFGCFEVWIDGEPMPRLRSRKSQLLLGILFLKGSSPTSRDWLCETIWPDSFVAQARLSLRQSLADVRRSLGRFNDHISTIGTSDVSLRLEGLNIDYIEFDKIVAQADSSNDEVEHAVSLHRGHLLEGIHCGFVEQERERRLVDVSRLLVMRAERAEDSEGSGAGIPYLRRAIAVNPFDERTARQLMVSLASSGAVAEALETFRKLQGMLRDQFDLEPSEETVETYNEIRAQVQSQHRRTGTPLSGHSTVPRQLTELIGRELELASLEALVPSCQIVTITGLGGVGKTQLAIELCHLLTKKGDSIVYVKVANVANAVELRETLRVKLGITQSWSIAEWLCTRELVIVLDECERVIPDVADLISELIDTAPQVRFLVTCRIPLGLYSEVVFPLGPLPVPTENASPSALQLSPAMTLLEKRLRLVNPRWTPTAAMMPELLRIVRRLEGLPLAIELAAAQTRVLSLTHLSERLGSPLDLLRSSERDRPARHRSLLLVLEESYGLLPDASRQALRLLAFFVDGFSLDAAEIMLGDSAVERLSTLVDACLVQRSVDADEETRYYIFDTIREFILGVVLAEDRAVATERRYIYVRKFCETANERVITFEQARWIKLVEQEMNTIRATLDSSHDNVDFARLVSSLIMFWHLTSRTQEPLALLKIAVERRDGVPPGLLSRIEAGYGTISWHLGDLLEAKARFGAAVELAQLSGEKYPLASALNGFSIVSRRLGFYQEAFDASEKSHMLMRECGTEARVIRSLVVWARAATTVGRLDQAEAMFAEAIEGFLRIGDDREWAHSLEGLAVNFLEQGRLPEAKALHRKAIEALAKFDDAFRLGWSFASVAKLLLREGRISDAARALGLVRSLERAHRFEVVSATSPRDQASLSELQVLLGEPALERLFAEVESLSLSNAVTLVLALLEEQGNDTLPLPYLKDASPCHRH